MFNFTSWRSLLLILSLVSILHNFMHHGFKIGGNRRPLKTNTRRMGILNMNDNMKTDKIAGIILSSEYPENVRREFLQLLLENELSESGIEKEKLRTTIERAFKEHQIKLSESEIEKEKLRTTIESVSKEHQTTINDLNMIRDDLEKIEKDLKEAIETPLFNPLKTFGR